jgi:hypothetical protein
LENNGIFSESFFALKKAEPLAILASLSLVISVFTFDHRTDFGNIYNYSVVSTFMFLFAFMCAIIPKGKTKKSILSDMLYTSGTFFFLAVGLIYLVLIAVEFGKENAQIISLAASWFLSFIGGASFYAAYKIYHEEIKNKTTTETKVFSYVSIIASCILGLFMAIMVAGLLLDTYLGIKLGSFIPFIIIIAISFGLFFLTVIRITGGLLGRKDLQGDASQKT